MLVQKRKKTKGETTANEDKKFSSLHFASSPQLSSKQRKSLPENFTKPLFLQLSQPRPETNPGFIIAFQFRSQCSAMYKRCPLHPRMFQGKRSQVQELHETLPFQPTWWGGIWGIAKCCDWLGAAWPPCLWSWRQRSLASHELVVGGLAFLPLSHIWQRHLCRRSAADNPATETSGATVARSL